MSKKSALIVEIYKNYCIVVTGDGQFLKQEISAGTYEIGDSIIVAEKEPDRFEEKSAIFRILSRVAAGFAIVAVIAFGSYFGINFLRTGRSQMTVALQDSVLPEAAQAAVEEAAAENEIGQGQETPSINKQQTGEGQLMKESSDDENYDMLNDEMPQTEDAAQVSNAAPVLFEVIHNIADTDQAVLIDYKDIIIDYSVEEPGTESDGSGFEKSLLFNFMQNKKDHFFNGNIDTILNDANSSAIKTVKMIFENFEYGAKKTQEVELENDARSFTLVIYGSFN
ncbi:MAG: anti-sigma factor domain-containing protein [Actinobacteria bacterium]|nr:anti-sigma factor domain-containing protein [Actinomycetota bacterium]